MKRVIKGALDGRDYEVNVNFAGYIGADNQYSVYARDEDDAIDQAIEEARWDLEVINVEDLGDGDWNVTIGFNGFIGVEEEYEVYADTEEEAEELAIEEAVSDLEAEIWEDEDDEHEDEEE